MINEKELETITLSATKKDFYQIWNELLDTASKLSKRWDPTSTNESDPGIILLKVLTAIADKLNYTIDKNILEAFMPSAAQEESMRKLCDMMGYNMKYYQSATTDVTISYTNSETTIAKKLEEGGGTATSIKIPRFTPIKNTDDTVNYFTLEEITLEDNIKSKIVACMEGSISLCADDTDNIISLNQLDDSFRYFLPENQIAENGIFITNVSTDNKESSDWEKVENLNTQTVGKKCFKFGFDSRIAAPYVQFPEDIGNIIEDGLIIRYTRTNGINGNISYNTLDTFTVPEDISTSFESTDFSVKNASAATNGKNKETINDAYNNYKKTIGTFDTLVTCRDYMNKIYQMTTDDANITPLVSNIIVSDIRDDINKAINLCTFNQHGIAYVDKSLKEANGTSDKISHFDLVLYPFTTINGSATYDNYINSFKYSKENLTEIETNLEKNKTISHKINSPDNDELACIKIYLKLKAKITTTAKVTAIEEKLILNNIYSAIYENFNSRKIDFGEEIPFDTILEVIQNADVRIKNVALEEPILAAKFCLVDGTEELEEVPYNRSHNKLALRNVLAGRLPLFDYYTDFKPEYNEKAYGNGISPEYPTDTKKIKKVESEFNIYAHNPSTAGLTLNENEIIQFRAPNFKTIITYPAYVNYFLHLSGGRTQINKDEEYELTGDDWLAINYTPSVTNEDGTTSAGSPLNVVYDANSAYKIIRPNFIIYDSTQYKADGHSPSKTSGYDGMPEPQRTVINNGTKPGMFAFGTNEQVEIRGAIEVKLDGNVTKIYWKRNDEKDYLDPATKKITFNFNEDNNTAYTLKEGEYIYYTDDAEIDLAWYGNGTKVIKNGTFDLYKYEENDTEELEKKIASEGLLAGLPWVSYKFDKDTNYLILKEYQYVNLVAGDIIYKLKTSEATTDLIDLTKNWSDDITEASYKYKDTDSPINLSTISIASAKWKARSILSMNMASTVTQTLHSTGTQTGTAPNVHPSKTENKITVYYNDTSTTEATITPAYVNNAYENVSIKSNYILQSSAGKETIDTEIDDFKIKTFSIDAINTRTDIGNFGSGNWTKVSFKESPNDIVLNVLLKDNTKHGLIMIHNTDTDPDITHHAYITITETGKTINICNSSNASSALITDNWWSNGKENNKYYLRNDINVIEIPKSCTITIHKGSTDAILIFSNLDIVNYNSELTISPRIDYKDIDNGSSSAQILYDIATIDPNYNFYYNAIIDNSLAIDFNTNITDSSDSDYEKLSTPTIYYDYNNINNKFVISEIDADYLKTGITLTSASRK